MPKILAAFVLVMATKRHVHDARLHALLPDHGHPVLDSVDTVRDSVEALETEFLCLVKVQPVTARRLEFIPRTVLIRPII